MTEAEARKKWCPMVRFDGDEGGTFNRGAASDPTNINGGHNFRCSCVGSRCMFWGWGDPTPDMDDQKGRCEAPGGAA